MDVHLAIHLAVHLATHLAIHLANHLATHFPNFNLNNNTVSTLHYRHQGKYDEAVAHHEQALRIYENAFGVNHINCANSINNLGITYRHQGKYDEAVAHYERALKIKENAFGVDYINCVSTIMNIGLFYQSQGQMTLAKNWLLRGYHIFRQNLGELHPDSQKAIRLLQERENAD